MKRTRPSEGGLLSDVIEELGMVKSALARAALKYAELGFTIFPCREKRPRTSNGFKDASNDPDIVAEWWRRWPDANIGCSTGAGNGFWVLDVDGLLGQQQFDRLCEQHDKMELTAISRTPNSGRHMFFNWDPDHPVKSRHISGYSIDTKGEGGYVIMPPSVGTAGCYSWLVSLFEHDTLDAPEWLLEWVTTTDKLVRRLSQSISTPTLATVERVAAGSRHSTLLSLIGREFASGATATEVRSRAQALLASGRVEAVSGNGQAKPFTVAELNQLVDYCSKKQDEEVQTLVAAPEPSSPSVEPFPTTTCGALITGSFPRDFLIDGLLVAGPPMLIAGPPKSFKTTLAIELSLSLGAGAPFLGRYRVPRPIKTCLMAAESDLAELQMSARAIAAARGIDPMVCSAMFSVECPRIGKLGDLERLQQTIRAHDLEVIIIDPAYRVMPSADTGNVIAQGDVLAGLAKVCSDCDSQLVLCHHQNKASGYRLEEPPQLLDTAQAGYAEWAAQWLLVRAREPVDYGGLHRLWVSHGGRGFRGAVLGLDIEEYPQDGSERSWHTKLLTHAQVIEERQYRKNNAKDLTKQQRSFERQIAIRAALLKCPDGATLATLKTMTNIRDHATFKAVFDAIVASGDVTQCDLPSKPGQRSHSGWKLKTTDREAAS